MATIITQPASLSLSANLGRFEIAASSEVSFKLSQGGSTIIDESFTPNAAGRVIIDIKDVVRNNLALDLPTTDIFQQTSIAKIFTAEIDELADVVFTVIRGGVENLSETPSNFLLANWLTWQPQTKQVSNSQPEWLTYYATAAAVVKVKFYLANNTTSIITLHSPAAGTCYTYNMQFAYIMTLQAGNKYGYYDVWVENEAQQRVSYIQRYIYRALESIDEYFVFENSLGGLDTAVMTGESTFAPDIQHNEGVYDEVSSQLDSIVSRLYTKNTGWKPKPEADWLFDFFNSKSKYKVNSGTLRKIVIVESPVDDTSSEDLKSFEFKYKYSTDLGLLNLSRSMDAPAANLEITTPEGLFFLAPRLVDFPAADLEDTLLFPVQSPFSQTWKKFSWGQMWTDLMDRILASAIGIMAHVHDNLAILAALGANAGKLTYNGTEVGGGSGVGVQLGETAQTAYRGDRGKTAYDHSQNATPHITSTQKTALTKIINEYISLAEPLSSGMLITTLIPADVTADYINIDLKGFGKVDAGPFSWSGQVYITSGAFADATIKSIGGGELLDVRIFIQDAVVKVWMTGRSKAISNFYNIQAHICYGNDLANLIDEITDAEYPSTGVSSAKQFKDFTEIFMQPLSAADKTRLDKAVVATDTTQYKIWVGTAPDYAAISQKDPNTFYYIT